MSKLKLEKTYRITGALILIGLLLAVAGILFYRYQFQNIEKEIKEELKITTQFKLLHLRIWLKERYEFGESIINNQYAVQSFYRMVSNKKKGRISENHKELFDYYLNNFEYKNILLFSDTFDLVNSAGADAGFYRTKVKEIIDGHTNKDSVSLSDFYENINDSLRISIVVPLKFENKHFGWILVVTNPDDELKPFLELSQGNLNTLSTLLVYKDNLVIRYPVLSGESLEVDSNIKNVCSLILKAVNMEKGYVAGRDNRDIEAIVYTEKFPGTSFYLISKIDKKEIIDRAAVYAKASFTFLMLLFSISVLLIITNWRNNKLKFYKREYNFEKEKNILLRHYDYLSKYANDIILLIDEGGIIKQANEKAVYAYGYTLDELTGMSGGILRSEEFRNKFVELLSLADDDDGTVYETVHQRKNGERFPVEVSVRPFNIEGSKFFQAIVRDITERKAAEDKLKENEMQYRTIFNNTNDAIFLRDELIIIDCNERAVSMFGYTREEMIGKTPVDLSPEYQRKNQKTIEAAKKKLEEVLKGNPQSFEWNYLKANGSILEAEVYINKIELNGKILTLSIVTDVTERRKAEKIIKEHSIMLNSVSQAVMATDLNGKITFWNEASEKLYGWSKSEILGKNILEFTSNEKGRIQIAEVFDKLVNGESWSGEFVGEKKDGTLFPSRVNHTPIFNSQNELIAIVSVSEDLTEPKARERELLRAKEKAEEINKLKTIFLSNMSHEVRTPLIGILGYAEMILDENYDPELKEKVGIIYKSGKKLNDTLDTILDISKIESGKIDISYERFNLGELIKESLFLYRIFAEGKGIALKFYPGTNGLHVDLDKRIFSKIINNLLSNAIKYTNTGEVIVSASYTNNSIKVEVEDTGIGIPEDKLNIVFEPFRQVSEGYNRKFEGTGLGLTITKMFVEKMNGKINLESTYGKGSKITVEFPVL